MLTSAKEAHFSANTSGDLNFTDMQASYSPINHLGIIGNFSTYTYKVTGEDLASGNVSAHAHLAELGAGYYYATKGNAKNVKIVFDAYGGAGGGTLLSDVNMNFFRSFIQPGAGIRTPYFEFSINCRIADIKYYNLNTNGHDSAYLAQQNLLYGHNKSITNTNYLFAEPAITMRGGYKFIKIQSQYVISNAISHVPWNYNGGLINIGLSFELEDLLKIINNSKLKKTVPLPIN